MRSRPAPADPYFPRSGDTSFDVQHYDLSLAYRLEGNQLRGRAVLEAVALRDLREVRLNLYALQVKKLQVDGQGLPRYVHKNGVLTVRFREPVAAGRRFRLTIAYQGSPTPVPDGEGAMGWEELADGVLVSGQTGGAPSWFPCNDRPSNKASYRIELTVPSTYHVVANGELTAGRRGASATTWVYEQREPMATYLATVQIGRYVVRPLPGSQVPMSLVLPERLAGRYEAAFGRQAEMMELFVRLFGPYPFPAYTAVVTADDLEIPLEAQGMSVFGANFLEGGWENVRLVAHELCHQWFGNSLTLAHWRDIWLHEGFACYGEWLWSGECGSGPTDRRARDHWRRLSVLPQSLVLGDPGPDDMFDDRVYKRGALLLHALRLTIGEERFFSLLRTWVARNVHGNVRTAMFVALAEEVSGRSLQDFFTAWLDRTALPELPPAA